VAHWENGHCVVPGSGFKEEEGGAGFPDPIHITRHLPPPSFTLLAGTTQHPFSQCATVHKKEDIQWTLKNRQNTVKKLGIECQSLYCTVFDSVVDLFTQVGFSK
jgi:hypothetical protein